MQVSSKCLSIIRSCEWGPNPYPCPAGISTIGYGSTLYADGSLVTLSDPPITQEHADEIMKTSLNEYQVTVNRYVSVPLN
jgi:lysozyme